MAGSELRDNHSEFRLLTLPSGSQGCLTETDPSSRPLSALLLGLLSHAGEATYFFFLPTALHSTIKRHSRWYPVKPLWVHGSGDTNKRKYRVKVENETKIQQLGL